MVKLFNGVMVKCCDVVMVIWLNVIMVQLQKALFARN